MKGRGPEVVDNVAAHLALHSLPRARLGPPKILLDQCFERAPSRGVC